jgi:hypothetical protein
MVFLSDGNCGKNSRAGGLPNRTPMLSSASGPTCSTTDLFSLRIQSLPIDSEGQLHGCYAIRTKTIWTFGARIEVVFRFEQMLFSKGVQTVRSRVKKKSGYRDEPIEPNKTNPKKQYSPPRFDVLTPDQVKVRLTESASPGEAAAEQLLRAASQPGPGGTDDQRSIPGGAKLRRTGKGA